MNGTKSCKKTAVVNRPRFLRIDISLHAGNVSSGERNRLRRTNVHAGATIAANVSVHVGFFVLNLNGVQRTCLNALAATVASFLIYNRCHHIPPGQSYRLPYCIKRGDLGCMKLPVANQVTSHEYRSTSSRKTVGVTYESPLPPGKLMTSPIGVLPNHSCDIAVFNTLSFVPWVGQPKTSSLSPRTELRNNPTATSRTRRTSSTGIDMPPELPHSSMKTAKESQEP